jgi:hypothetical protein
MAAEQKELRQLSNANLLDLLDACALARNMERAKLINKVLAQWAAGEVHRTNVLNRAAKGNPLLSETPGNTSDWGDLG